MARYTFLARPHDPDGHRFYVDDRGALVIADNSGPTPETTDDGPLMLDPERDIEVSLTGSHPSIAVPVRMIDHGRERSRVLVTVDDLHWLIAQDRRPCGITLADRTTVRWAFVLQAALAEGSPARKPSDDPMRVAPKPKRETLHDATLATARPTGYAPGSPMDCIARSVRSKVQQAREERDAEMAEAVLGAAAAMLFTVDPPSKVLSRVVQLPDGDRQLWTLTASDGSAPQRWGQKVRFCVFNEHAVPRPNFWGSPAAMSEHDSVGDALCAVASRLLSEGIVSIPEGARVLVTQPIERFPHARIEVGAKGTVALVDDNEAVWVRLDDTHDGLAEWENEVGFVHNSGLLYEFFTSCEVVP